MYFFFLFCALLKETIISRFSTTEQEYSIRVVYPFLKSSLVSGFRMFEQEYDIVLFLLCALPRDSTFCMFEQEYSTVLSVLCSAKRLLLPDSAHLSRNTISYTVDALS